MFCTSQSRHACVLLRHLDHRCPFIRICLWLRPARSRIRPVLGSVPLQSARSPAGRWGRGRWRARRGWDCAPCYGPRWESGSQGDKVGVIWGAPKEDVPLARAGGLATIGNHVVLRRAQAPVCLPDSSAESARPGRHRPSPTPVAARAPPAPSSPPTRQRAWAGGGRVLGSGEVVVLFFCGQASEAWTASV